MVNQIEVIITGINDETFQYTVNPTMTTKQFFQDINKRKVFPKYGKSLDYRKFWLTIDGKCVYDNERFSKVNIKEGSTIRVNIRMYSTDDINKTKNKT